MGMANDSVLTLANFLLNENKSISNAEEPSDSKEKQHHINQYSDEKRLSSFMLREISPKTSQFVEANFILEQALGFGETQEQPHKRDVLRQLRRMFVKLSTHVLHITDPWEKHVGEVLNLPSKPSEIH